ncbi:hypothetical protein NM208_g129 [Fusarium decemcellulare]|uniref:Uncharacterized protein n=1 Tax=Fusarium decemcellulare TaxID=57161 RepID=A0ACC1T0E3_9HYPO|nr:hypothetical protein NM208_g129 [Fusarium decemcellulare]
MRPTLLLAFLPSLGGAVQFELITGNCDTGWSPTVPGGFAGNSIKRVGDDGCSGCNLFTERSDGVWYGASPCNPCNGGIKYEFVPNGSGRNIYRAGNRNNIIGHCEGRNGPYSYCNRWNFSCVGLVRYICSVSEC